MYSVIVGEFKVIFFFDFIGYCLKYFLFNFCLNLYYFMVGFGYGLVYVFCIILINYYFEWNWVLVNGIVFLVSGVGGFLFLYIYWFFLDCYVFSGVMIIFGGIMLNICVVVLFLR